MPHFFILQSAFDIFNGTDKTFPFESKTKQKVRSILFYKKYVRLSCEIIHFHVPILAAAFLHRGNGKNDALVHGTRDGVCDRFR